MEKESGQTLKYIWGNNSVRAKYKGQICKVLAYGKMRSVLVEFSDGHRMITDRYALRK